MSARIAGCKKRLVKLGVVARTEGVQAVACHIVEALVVEHAHGGFLGKVAHAVAAGTLTRTALGVRLQLATFAGFLVGVVAAILLLAFVGIAAVACFPGLNYTVATQRSIVF